MNTGVVKLLSCLIPIRKYRRMFRDKYMHKNSVLADKGVNNRLIILDDEGNETDLKWIENLKIYFEGNNSEIRIYQSAWFQQELVIQCKSEVFVSIGKSCCIGNLSFPGGINDNNCLIIDDNTWICGAMIVLCDEPGRKVEIGKDCMFSNQIMIRYSDGHAILDYETKKIANFPKNIKIGNHCWLGWGVKVLKGANIPDNSVVGIDSVYTSGSNPAAELFFGGGIYRLSCTFG